MTANDDANIRAKMLELVRLAEENYGEDSDEARVLRGAAAELVKHMDTAGPDHGLTMDERNRRFILRWGRR